MKIVGMAGPTAYIAVEGDDMKFEAFKAKNGKFRWHLRDASGRIVPIRAGKVMLPPTSAPETQRFRRAADHSLSLIAAEAAKGAKG